MKKRIKKHVNLRLKNNRRGLTLTELIVASLLVAIVMMAVTAFSISIKEKHHTINKSAVLSMKTAAALSQIKQDAAIATGTGSDPGIWWLKEVDNNYLCFRHDVVNPAIGEFTPNDFLDDDWVCYWAYNLVGPPVKRLLYRCTPNTDIALGPVPPYAGDRPATGLEVSSNCNITGIPLVPLSDIDFFSVDPVTFTGETITGNPAAARNLNHIDIFLKAIDNPGNLFDPLDNPGFSAHTRLRPTGQSSSQ